MLPTVTRLWRPSAPPAAARRAGPAGSARRSPVGCPSRTAVQSAMCSRLAKARMASADRDMLVAHLAKPPWHVLTGPKNRTVICCCSMSGSSRAMLAGFPGRAAGRLDAGSGPGGRAGRRSLLRGSPRRCWASSSGIWLCNWRRPVSPLRNYRAGRGHSRPARPHQHSPLTITAAAAKPSLVLRLVCVAAPQASLAATRASFTR